MKCQHGQIITKFCISDNCNYKTSAACIYCLKRNHNHSGHVETLSFKQVDQLIATLTIQKDKKLRQSSLKQLLINYFQTFKNQISKSLQIVCKNMIDRISNSLLFKQNLLETFKKLKSKQFTKISSLEMKQFYGYGTLNMKKTQYLQKQQQQLYFGQVFKIQQTINKIKSTFQTYQAQIQSYDKHFSPDSFFYKRIVQLSDKILLLQQDDIQTQSFVNNLIDKNTKSKVTQIIKINPQLTENHNKTLLEPQINEQPMLLSLQEYKNIKSTESLRSKQTLNPQTLKVSNLKRQRKPSIALDSQLSESPSSDKRQSSNKNSDSSDHKNNKNQEYKNDKIQIKFSKIKSNNEKENKLNDNKKQNFKTLQNFKAECSCQSYEIHQESNYNRKGSDHLKLNILSPKLTRSPSVTLEEQFHCKECNSFDFNQSQIQQNKHHALDTKMIKLPPSDEHQQVRLFQHKQDVKKKIIKLEMKAINLENPDQAQSPLIKKRIKSKEKQNLELIKSQNPLSKQQKLLPRKLSSTQDISLNDNQLKSLALLLQSIKLPQQKAIKYLRKSFQYCPQNLSTAQYLSYLLIQSNHPKQCLQLCNLMIAKIYTHTQNFKFSVHILNNKAAALNELGRFSQSIQFLQKIVERIQKDSLYKNLADAYCALGIYEKSIINYQKCIGLNKQYDDAFYNLGVCFYSQQHYEQALVMVSQAIRLNSDRDEYIQLYRNTKSKVI